MKQMKNFKLCLAAASILSALTVSLSSCSVDNVSPYPNPNAIVTIKTTDSGNAYFQMDQKTTLDPVNWKNPYKREVRAMLRYSEEPGDAGVFSKKVRVEWIDSVRTKNAVLYDEDFKAKEKTAPLSLFTDWMTCCEDGYLTLHFAAWFGSGRNITHTIELAVDPETRGLYLWHDDNGDSTGPMVIGEGLIAFKLDELLKDAKDGDILTLHWKDYGDIDGVEKTAELKYLSRFSLSER